MLGEGRESSARPAVTAGPAPVTQVVRPASGIVAPQGRVVAAVIGIGRYQAVGIPALKLGKEGRRGVQGLPGSGVEGRRG